MKKFAKALAILLLATSAQAWEFMFSSMGWNVDLDMYGLPEHTSGVKWNNLTLSPYLEVLYGYDSNPGRAHKGSQSSTVGTMTLGSTMAYTSFSTHTSFSGNIYFSTDQYVKNSRDNNKKTFGAQFSQRHSMPSGWYATLSEGYIRGMYNDYSLGTIEKYQKRKSASRDTMSLGLGIGRSSPGSNWTYGGNLAYEQTSYSDKQYYNKHDNISAGLSLGRAISAKTSANLSGSWSHRTSKYTDDVDSYSLQAGLSTRLQPKVTYNTSLGLRYSRAANGWDNWGASYDLGAGWKISQKWSASLHGSSWLQPSEIATPNLSTENYVSMYHTIGGGVNYIPLRRLSTTTQYLFRRGQFKYIGAYDPDKGYALNDCVDNLHMLRFAATFTLTRYLSLVGSAQYQTMYSDMKEREYDEYSASLGLRLKY